MGILQIFKEDEMSCPNGFYLMHPVTGQVACVNPDDAKDGYGVASGYYLMSNEAMQELTDAGENWCGDTGIRPGFMVIKGAGTLNTCGGRITTEQMPDVNLVNSRYRPWMLGALLLLVGTTAIFAGVEFIKWWKR